VTTAPDEDLEQRLPVLLDGYNGIFQVQLLGPHVIDINPRVYGSMALATQAGANLPDILCRLLRREAFGEPRPVRAAPGVLYRWLEGELKHAGDGMRAGDLTWHDAMSILRPERGVAYGDVAVTDPVPSAGRLLHVAGSRWRDRRVAAPVRGGPAQRPSIDDLQEGTFSG
jgi:hypothetical protein